MRATAEVTTATRATPFAPRRVLLTLATVLLASGDAACFAGRSSSWVRGAGRCRAPVAEVAATAGMEFAPLATPAAYEELLARVEPADVTVIKYQSPFCRSCRKPSALLEGLAEEWPQAAFYTMDLVIDGKAAGRRMKAFFKERHVTEIPHVEVYRGNVLVRAGPDRGEAAERCVITREAVTCVEDEGGERRPLRVLMDGS